MADYDIGVGDGETNMSAIMLMMVVTEGDPIRFDEAVTTRNLRINSITV